MAQLGSTAINGDLMVTGTIKNDSINAHTLDGLNSTDFSFSKTITLAELNDASLPSGIYNIQNITLDSVGLPGSYAHIYNGGGYGSYGSQIAIPYSNGTMNGVWYRVANGVYPIFKRIDNISYGTTASTTANAYGVTLVGATLTTGQEILLKFNSSNTIVNPTLNVNVLGAKGIKFNGNDLLVNMIPTNAFIPLVYDGSYWQITSLDTAFNYVATTASATANAYTVSYPGFNLVSGMMIPVRFNSTNTVVAPTLNINGTGAKPIKRSNLPLVVNEITANEPSMVYYDGASYQVFGIESIATNILMTGYAKGTSVTPIVATDTAGSAIGKLEAGKAPLASPVFTGTPTAPTAVSTTNTTQIATTAFVKTLISELINNSPTALDTLKELATALGNDPNFATTMTNLIGTKANLASPVFTGTPKAPTPTKTDNSTNLATTAFVQSQGFLIGSSTIDGGTF